MAGNPLAADSTWSFTTAAASPSGCPCSIWGTSAIPAKAAETTDTAALEVGVRFRPTTDGRVTALRFYKGATNTGTHTGHLWTSTGTLLATATFANETATGWQEVTLPTPVNVTANTTYVASYYAPKGNYAVDEDYFTSAGVDSPPLRALKDGEDGGNGLYGYGALGTFPTSTYRSENYWVDLVFQTGAAPPDTTPPTITAVSATPAADGSATVTWTTDEPANSRVDYGTSPSTLDQNVSDATRATTHSVRLTGLTSGATYSFRVTSVDAAGNSTTSPAAPAAPAAFSMPFTASPAAAAIESGGGSYGLDSGVAGRGRQRVLPGQLDYDGHAHDIVVRRLHRPPHRAGEPARVLHGQELEVVHTGRRHLQLERQHLADARLARRHHHRGCAREPRARGRGVGLRERRRATRPRALHDDGEFRRLGRPSEDHIHAALTGRNAADLHEGAILA